jgi:hypothetical protein
MHSLLRRGQELNLHVSYDDRLAICSLTIRDTSPSGVLFITAPATASAAALSRIFATSSTISLRYTWIVLFLSLSIRTGSIFSWHNKSSFFWSPRTGSNRRHPVYKTGALPAELRRLIFVPEARVELARPYGHEGLNLARLPVTPFWLLRP